VIGARGWQKLGRILAPEGQTEWLRTFAGPSWADRIGVTNRYRLYVTGRDQKNRSLIGTAEFDISNPKAISQFSERPIFTRGELGAFDQSGVSYPCIARSHSRTFMYYVGWTPTVLTPFQNHIGLAEIRPSGEVVRVSRAPILERTDTDPLCMGSVYVMVEGEKFRMWYTAFERWGTSEAEPKHFYRIKYAESEDGIHWERNDQVCIDFQNASEYAIGKPSVYKNQDGYHMWYVHRGEQYRIGYATSEDGIRWQRRDALVGLDVSANGWDSKAICYPQVFEHGEELYMLYNGNDYGREGLGIARLLR
jgi:hypothetical protein